MLVVEDESGGIFIRWAGTAEDLILGARVEIVGVTAAPYGQTELREIRRLAIVSAGDEPEPARMDLSDIGEATEGRLVTIRGTAESVVPESGRLTVVVGDGSTGVRVVADSSTGLTRSDVVRGDVVLVTGIVGQRSSASGKQDGYRVWLRSRSDLLVRPVLEADPPVPAATPPGRPTLRDLSALVGMRGRAIDVEATVTATAGLFEINGPAIVVDDGLGAVAVVMPAGAAAPGVGMRVRVVGKVGSWQNGPTITASSVVAEGELMVVAPEQTTGPLRQSLEWRLVRVFGRIERAVHAGSRSRLDLVVEGRAVAVLGEPIVGLQVDSSYVGRLAMVIGIVRRSTSDNSVFQLLPRSSLDVRFGPATKTVVASDRPGSGSVWTTAEAQVVEALGKCSGEVASLESCVGLTATVAGLVTDTTGGVVVLDDGTGRVRLGGPDAAEAMSLLEPGDAIEATGTVAQDETGLLITVDPSSLVVLSGDGSSGVATRPSPNAATGDAAGAVVTAPNQAESGAAGSAAPGAIAGRRLLPLAPPPDAVALVVLAGVVLAGCAAALAVGPKRAALRRRWSHIRRRLGLPVRSQGRPGT
jgi:hypothetical protein